MREKSNLMLIFFPFLIVQIDVDVRVEGDPLVFLVGVADKVIEVAEGGPIDEDVSELVDVVDELLIDCVFGDDGFGDGEFIWSFEVVEDVLFDGFFHVVGDADFVEEGYAVLEVLVDVGELLREGQDVLSDLVFWHQSVQSYTEMGIQSFKVQIHILVHFLQGKRLEWILPVFLCAWVGKDKSWFLTTISISAFFNLFEQILPGFKFDLKNLRIRQRFPLLFMLSQNLKLIKKKAFEFPIFNSWKIGDLLLIFFIQYMWEIWLTLAHPFFSLFQKVLYCWEKKHQFWQRQAINSAIVFEWVLYFF